MGYLLVLCVLPFVLTGFIFEDVYGILYFDYSEYVKSHQEKTSWSVGHSLSEGDYFEYTICNDVQMSQVIYPSHCYDISLEFFQILESSKGNMWIVQGYLEYNDIVSPVILLIDTRTFEVTTDLLHTDLGNSLENTIFSLSKYGDRPIQVGNVWDHIDSYLTHQIPLEIKKHDTVQSGNFTFNTSVLGYEIIVPSNTYIDFDFPFPIKSELYSPSIIFPEPKELSYFIMTDFDMGGISP